MVFYHGTTEEKYKEILKEGVLFGRRYITDDNGTPIKEVDRCTYLTSDIDEARCYGDVILCVEYEPTLSRKNNYVDGCWQFRVYEPIPMENIKNVIIDEEFPKIIPDEKMEQMREEISKTAVDNIREQFNKIVEEEPKKQTSKYLKEPDYDKQVVGKMSKELAKIITDQIAEPKGVNCPFDKGNCNYCTVQFCGAREESHIETRSTTEPVEEEPTCKDSLQVEVEEHPDNFTSFEWLVGRLMFRGCDLWGMTDGEDDNGIVTKLIKDKAVEMMALLERKLDLMAEPVDLEKPAIGIRTFKVWQRNVDFNAKTKKEVTNESKNQETK